VRDQTDHLNFWCDRAHLRRADFLFRSSARIASSEMASLATGDAEQDLHVLLQRVNAVGHRVLLCDLTTRDVAEMGLAVVRAIVPGFHPLVVGHRIRSLGGTRMWTIPQRLGYEGITRERGDNPAPHPYP
jgi:ribosomal protein S12 methylthiotransferase accessory factor